MSIVRKELRAEALGGLQVKSAVRLGAGCRKQGDNLWICPEEEEYMYCEQGNKYTQSWLCQRFDTNEWIRGNSFDELRQFLKDK